LPAEIYGRANQPKYMPFAELGLSKPILDAVRDAGYTEPTPIQKRAIPHVLQGRDVLASAQTGTGKTASFTLPMIDILAHGRARARMPRSLILEPTRELAAQVAENFELYGKNNRLSMALLIGGVSFDDQRAVIDRGADVLIATPGRLLDHFERGGLLLRGVDILVIDEADRMLDMGFIPDVERIVQLTNPKRQTLFFSATMPPEIKRLADKFLKDPEEITVAPPASPAETVDQHLSIVEQRDKRDALRALLREQPVKNAFVFCNRKRDVDIVDKSLRKHGFNSAALHGDMSQAHRMKTLESFKAGEIQLLVCSDVAARGIDVQGMSHVFLFDVPIHADDYVHRIGRTGRAGMPGRAFSLAAPEDAKFVAEIERIIGREIPRYVIEGVDSQELDEADGKRRRRRKPRGEDADKKTSTRGRSRGRKKDADEDAATDAVVDEADTAEVAEPAPAKAERKTPKAKDAPAKTDDKTDAQPEMSKAEAPKAETSKADAEYSVTGGSITRPGATPAKRKDDKKSGGRRRSGDDDKPVVGMGDHVPAFMLRTAKR
jgi:superfamily II DNA/RNA helicase